MDPGGVASPVQGIQAKEPAFGLPALWVDEQTRQAAELAGYTVVDPLTVLITHLTEIIRRHADELLSRQTVQELLDGVREREPAAVQGLVPDLLSLADVQRVLQRLLHERVSIRDLVPILEALGDAARFTKSIDLLTEEARRALARWLCQTYQAADGKIHVVMLDPRTEQFLTDRIRTSEQGSHLLL
ncbi:MAG TPA: FHIPEP family type III secretion protein, partial [Armatimonadota bacterium]|nr:FHIPEP family type III secretion protein [Armatimonadota bacterium]